MSKQRHFAADEAHYLIRTAESHGTTGQSVAPHAHHWPQLISCVRGVLTVWTEVGSWIVPPQSAVWAPAGIRHGLRFSGDVELRALWFRPDFSLATLPRDTGTIAVTPLLRELIEQSVSLGMLDERIPVHHALAMLIGDSLAAHARAAFELPMPRAPVLLQLVLVASHAQFAHSPRELAAQACMSLRTLERRFTDDVGISLGRWLRQARMVESLRQLASGAPVKAVARRAGYRSPSAFVYAFRQAYGLPPGQYFSACL